MRSSSLKVCSPVEYTGHREKKKRPPVATGKPHRQSENHAKA